MSLPKAKAASREEALGALNGWLTEAGVFYGCAGRGHLGVALALGYGEDCECEEMARWLRLSGGEWEVFHDEITAAQREFIFAWCAMQGRELPLVLGMAVRRGL